MDSSDLISTVVKQRAVDPRRLAELLRKVTSRRIRFRPRTRAIFMFVGAIGIIVSWLTPWYNSLTWSLPSSGQSGIIRAGYESSNLSPGDIYAKWGLNPWSKTFTGRYMSTGPAAMRQIAFSRDDFIAWIALAVLALIAIWIYERPRASALTMVAHRWIYVAFESAEVILLVFVIARCVWKGYDLVNKASVNALAEKALYGATVPPASHFVTNYSFGLTILPLGLIFAALGVFSGNKEPKTQLDAAGNPAIVAPKIRVKALGMAVIAIVFIAITYGLFNG
jgi:hypothetical protein